MTDMQYPLHPEGLHQALQRAGAYGVPLIVTENGTATRDERLRTAGIDSYFKQAGLGVAGCVLLACWCVGGAGEGGGCVSAAVAGCAARILTGRGALPAGAAGAAGGLRRARQLLLDASRQLCGWHLEVTGYPRPGASVECNAGGWAS